MTNGILIIAHAPLASALRQSVLHVFPDDAAFIQAVDVMPNVPTDETLAMAVAAVSILNQSHTLVLTDMFGATPCNIAQKLVDGIKAKLIAGANLPMLVRAMTYRGEPLDALVARALSGGSQGVMQVASAAPQNQIKKSNDQDPHQHQQ